MKTINLFILILASTFMIACTSQNQPKSESELAIANNVNKKVEAKDFRIRVDYANPMGGRTVPLTSEYDLVIKNDSAFAYLPYFGVAYSAPYGSTEGGIKFSTLMEDYKSALNKKGEWTIDFKINIPNYNYIINISIFSNGKSSININSAQRRAINFDGQMMLD